MPGTDDNSSSAVTSIFGTDIPKQTAESLGIQLNEQLAKRLAADLEFRLRDTIILATKFMRHSKRSFMTTQDVNMALKAKNIEPMFGFEFASHAKFRSVPGHKLYYVQNSPIDLDQLISSPLPEILLEPNFSSHWLAIDGVQPLIVQNPVVSLRSDQGKEDKEHERAALERSKASMTTVKDGKSENKQDVMSVELQTYFKLLTDALLSNDKDKTQLALDTLAKDPALQALLPFFIQFITVTVARNLRSLSTLMTIMRALKSLLANPNLFIEPYLHQIMPNIVSCLVGKRLCENAEENHWELRDFAAELASELCKRFSASYQTLQPRYIKTLLKASLDNTKPIPTIYGAIAGMKAVGGQVTVHFLVKNLPLFDKYLASIKDTANSHEYKKLADLVESIKQQSDSMQLS